MSQITIAGGGAFTKKNIDDLNANITELYAGSTGGTFASPTITGTVAGGASYTAPTLTAVTITGTSTIGNGMTITTPVLSGSITGTYTLAGTPTLTAPTINAYTLTGTGTIGAGCTLTTPAIGAATGTSVVLSGNCRAASFNAGATAGVTAGPFTSVSSIASTAGLITTLTGT